MKKENNGVYVSRVLKLPGNFTNHDNEYWKNWTDVSQGRLLPRPEISAVNDSFSYLPCCA